MSSRRNRPVQRASGHGGATEKVRASDEHARAIAQGRADVRAGRFVTPEEIDSWIDSVGTPDECPVPQSKKQ